MQEKDIMMNEPLNHTVKDINGNQVDLNQYKGNTTLIVNVASKCGLTPQYKGLQELYDKYKDRNFTILGFPANDFMGQDHRKIGKGIESETKFPNKFVCKDGTILWDCPGFNDSRGRETEILQAYHMNSIAKNSHTNHPKHNTHKRKLD